jgi:hypothetical protein
MATKERALDIFWLLDQFNRKDYSLWEKLTDEQKKEFSPLVVMRWLAGTDDPAQLIFLNEIVNVSIFSLPNHPELLFKLLQVCCQGATRRHSWINYKVSGSSKKSKRSVELIAAHYHLTLKEAEDSRRLFSPEEILELGELHGLQKEELNELKKEIK